MKSKDLEEIREDGREFAELLKKIPKERKNEALRLLEGFALCAEHMCRKAGQEARKVDAMESYKNAERLAKEILKMCTEKGITLKELQMLKTALPIAIDQKVEECLSKERLS